jgi:hypothetical protein
VIVFGKKKKKKKRREVSSFVCFGFMINSGPFVLVNELILKGSFSYYEFQWFLLLFYFSLNVSHMFTLMFHGHPNVQVLDSPVTTMP